jgi:dTDP-4-amino-4,6-dideoxygalactose transaminase
MSAARKKTSLTELATSGGRPMFDEALHVGRPNILDPDALYVRIREAVDRKWLSNDGPFVLELERECARFLGVEHCVAVANATLGLQLLFRALDIRGKVLMPSFTFIATAHAAAWEGATPVFCDVLPHRHTLDPLRVREAMSDDVAAIMGVHVWGRSCEIDELQAIADEWGVPLLFDAAHAFGSSYKGSKVGAFGRAEVFSFHATKSINAIEGGLVSTNDDSLAARLRALRNFGFTGKSEMPEGLGINAKMNEFAAAMALSNLPHYDRLARHNRQLHSAYARALEGVRGIEIYEQDSASGNGHYAVFTVAAEAGIDRDRLIDILEAENIRARRYFWPGCHRSAPYSHEATADLAMTERLLGSVFQLPTGMQLVPDDAFAIGSLIRLCVTGRVG